MRNSPSLIAVGRFIAIAASLLTAPIIARELGPSDRGLMGSAVAALAITPILIGMGLPIVVRRLSSSSDPGPVVRSVRRLLPLGLPVAVGLAFLLAATLLPGLGPWEVAAFVVAMATTVLFISSICDQSVFVARQQYSRIAALQATQSLSYVAIILVLWPLGLVSFSSVVLALGAANTIAFVVARLQVRVGPGPRLPLRDVARQGAGFVGSQLTEASASRLDQLLAVVIIGAVDAGYYAVAATVASVPLALGHAVGSTLFRRIANAEADEQRQLVAFGMRTALLLGVVASAMLAAATPWAVPFLFGADFQPSVVPALVALVATPIFIANYVNNQSLAALGRGSAMLLSQGAGLAVGLVALLTLGPALGATGGALASGLGYAATMVVAARRLDLGISSVLYRRGDFGRAVRLFIRGY